VFTLVYGSVCVLKSVIMNHHFCQNGSSFSTRQTLRWNFFHCNVANISKSTTDNVAQYIAGGWICHTAVEEIPSWMFVICWKKNRFGRNDDWWSQIL